MFEEHVPLNSAGQGRIRKEIEIIRHAMRHPESGRGPAVTTQECWVNSFQCARCDAGIKLSLRRSLAFVNVSDSLNILACIGGHFGTVFAHPVYGFQLSDIGNV